jgi:hypothetical protein
MAAEIWIIGWISHVMFMEGHSCFVIPYRNICGSKPFAGGSMALYDWLE